MKRLELLVLQIFAVVCSYLITSLIFTTTINIASALDVSIHTHDGQELTAELFELSDFVRKEFHYPYLQNRQYIEIIISSDSSDYVIKKIYLFRCKDFNPVQCIENGIEPVISVSQAGSNLVFDETYRWNDVSLNNIGNFLILTKLDVEGKEVWTGAWDKITKTGIRQFYHENYGMDGLDVYLGSGVSGENAKNYIENQYSIPSDSVNNSVFQTIGGTSVSKLYDLSGNKEKIDPSGTGIPEFYEKTLSGNTFEENLRAWDFVFGSDGKTADPVVFYSAEVGGEPSPIEAGPELVIDDLSPQIVTCGSEETIQASMHVDNASNIGYFQSYYYEIDGERGGEGSITCSITNPSEDTYSYECSLPVAGFPNCTVGQSTLAFHFNYQGGVSLSASFPITLKAPQPRMIVDSIRPVTFDCGLDTELTADLRITNPMEGTPETHYTFDGADFKDLTCSGSGSLYTCEIPENEICTLLQEDLELTFKFAYDDFEIPSLPSQLFVNFPPPSMGIDTVTPQTVEAGETTSVNVRLHVNYPDFITYDLDDFNFKYLDKGFQQVTCSLDESFTDIKYYECTVDLEIPSDEDGVETLTFRLDGYMGEETKQLTANTFFEILPPPPEPSLRIISTSSPLDCIQDPSLTVNARVENMEGTPDAYYSVDSGKTFGQLTCSPSGNTYVCSISKDDLCDLMSNVLTLILKFSYPGEDLISNPQNVYLEIPEPHIQVYSVQPDTLPTGERTSVTANLYVQYPEMVGDNPVFLYTYSGQTNQMSCNKVSSTNIRDYYECANTEFDIPDDYSGSILPVMFSIQGTTISFPVNIPVITVERTLPWLEIIFTTPTRIEVTAGNRTTASFRAKVHNALENNLEHQATLIPNSWISSGTCTESEINYEFSCDVTVNAPRTAPSGSNTVTLSLRVSDSRTFDISDTTDIYVFPEETLLEIQSVNPDRLYCEGHQQQNPQSVTITARVENLADFELVEEDMSFNHQRITHTAKYCTSTGQSITCEIPSDKFLEKVSCGRGELAPGEGSHYYPLTMIFIVESEGELVTVSGSRDVSIEARPLEPYLDIEDNDLFEGALQTPINCLGSQTIRLGYTDYVRIMYADLLHPGATEDDLTWSFRLDAHDDQGKLTRGMGVSPEANATICRLRDYQMIGGVHRLEDYECSLYTSTGMFQRCEDGVGELILTATSGGKKAEGRIDVAITKDESLYQLDMEIVSEPMKEIECQIQGQYGEGVPCSLASHSSQNVTIRIYNRNTSVGLTDLNLYDFDIGLTGTRVDPNLNTLGNCREDSREANKYVCPFRIGPAINLPDEPGYEVMEGEPEQTFDPISLGNVNITVYVRYAGDLARDTISRMDGEIKIQPRKSDAQVNMEKMVEEMQENFEKFEDVFKWVVFGLSFCTVCGAGNMIVDAVKGTMRPCGQCEEDERCDTSLNKCVPKDGKTEAPTTVTCSDCLKDNIVDGSFNAVKKFCEVSKQCVPATHSCPDMGTAILNPAYCPESASPQSPSEPETGGEGGEGGGGGAVWAVIGAAISLFLYAILFGKVFKTGDEDADVEEEKSEIMKHMEKGLKWGIAACVLPRIVGEMGAWIAEGGSPAERGFGKVAAFGEALGNVCNMLMQLVPIVMMFIQFYIAYLRFEMCMDTVELQIEASAQAAAQAQEQYQTQAGVQAGAAMMTNMMSCFDGLMDAMNRLTITSMLMTNQMGALGGRVSVTYTHAGKDVGGKREICGPGILRVDAYSLCKRGLHKQRIRIEGEDCGFYDEKLCTYTMPVIPSYDAGALYSGFSGAQRTSEIHGEIRTQECRDGTTIVVTVTGTEPIRKEFTYKKTCAEGEDGNGGTKTEGDACTTDSECRSDLECCYTKTSVSKVCSKPANCLKETGEICNSNDDCVSGLYCCFWDPSRSDKKCYDAGSNCICYDNEKGRGSCRDTCESDEEFVTSPEKPCPFPLTCCVQSS